MFSAYSLLLKLSRFFLQIIFSPLQTLKSLSSPHLSSTVAKGLVDGLSPPPQYTHTRMHAHTPFLGLCLAIFPAAWFGSIPLQAQPIATSSLLVFLDLVSTLRKQQWQSASTGFTSTMYFYHGLSHYPVELMEPATQPSVTSPSSPFN